MHAGTMPCSFLSASGFGLAFKITSLLSVLSVVASPRQSQDRGIRALFQSSSHRTPPGMARFSHGCSPAGPPEATFQR